MCYRRVFSIPLSWNIECSLRSRYGHALTAKNSKYGLSTCEAHSTVREAYFPTRAKRALNSGQYQGLNLQSQRFLFRFSGHTYRERSEHSTRNSAHNSTRSVTTQRERSELQSLPKPILHRFPLINQIPVECIQFMNKLIKLSSQRFVFNISNIALIM